MLKKPKPSQKGLKKLPTEVKNKMGYMKDGGSLYDMAKKVKPSGRLNADDLKKAKEMMEKKPSKFTVGKKKPIMEAPQTRTYGNKPTESVFQKLKRAQMLRKMSGK